MASKKKTVTSGGKTRVVKVGSKADKKYSSQPGAVSSSSRSSVDAAESSMKAAYKPGGSKSNNGPIDPNNPTAISSDTLAPATPIVLPTPPTPSATGTAAMTGVEGLANANPIVDIKPAEATKPDADFKAYLKSLSAPESTEKIYQKAEREAGVQQKQQVVNNLTGQLNAIVAKSQADKLSLVGQGRGVTDVIIGGQQAQIDREAAIQSLPISAQLAAAQGDLASAQDHLDTLFKIRSEDARNKYEYKQRVAEAVYNYASEKQKIALDEKRTQDDRNFTLQRDNISYARDLAATALENGQSSLAASLMRLDSSSSNYAKDIANLAGGIQAKSSSSDLIGIGTPEKQQLLGAGYSSGDINTLVQGINDYGFQSVYDGEKADGASKEKLAALAKVYNAPVKLTVAELRSATTNKFAADSLKSAYTEAELHGFAKDAGFGGFNLDSKTQEVEKFLNSEKAKEKYIALQLAAGLVTE